MVTPVARLRLVVAVVVIAVWGSPTPAFAAEGDGSGATPAPPPAGLVATDICRGVPRNTLLVDCDPCLSDNAACLVYDQVPDLTNKKRNGCDYGTAGEKAFCRMPATAKTCEFHCFPVFEDKTEFRFLIPFKTVLGEPVTRVLDSDGFVEFRTDAVPWQANNFVKAIGSLQMKRSVQKVVLSGGLKPLGTRGRIAELTVDPAIFASSPQVRTVELVNIALGNAAVASLLTTATMPAGLTILNLRNTKLTGLLFSERALLAALPQLRELTLSQNALSTVTAKSLTLPNLISLDLSENEIRSFDSATPRLVSLNLADNQLDEIPQSVFSMTSLRELNLNGNAIAAPLILTKQQVVFLNTLERLQMEPVTRKRNPSALPSTATSSTTITVSSTSGEKQIPVIVLTDKEMEAYLTAATTTSSSTSSSTTSGRPAEASGSADGDRGSGSGDVIDDGSTTVDGELDSGEGSSSSGGSDGLPMLSGRSSRRNSTANGGGDGEDEGDPESPHSRSRSSSSVAATITMIAVLVVGGCGFVVAVGVLLRRRRQKNDGQAQQEDGVNGHHVYTKKTSEEQDDTNDKTATTLSTATATARSMLSAERAEWMADDTLLSNRLLASHIQDIRVLAHGSSCVLWLVHYHKSGATPLVSKRLAIAVAGAATSASASSKLVREIQITAPLEHPSILSFVGVAWTTTSDLQVLFEYMPLGDLQSYLAHSKTTQQQSQMTWASTKLRLALDIIEALVYTHSFHPPLCHRDLRARKILLNEAMKAKLSGFGSARFESDDGTMTSTTMTGLDSSARWLAPEILCGSTSYGVASDLYAFGVLLGELDTHRLPYADLLDAFGPDGTYPPVESAILTRVANGSLRPSVSTDCPSQVRAVVDQCLAFDAAQRPTAVQVAYALRQATAGTW